MHRSLAEEFSVRLLLLIYATGEHAFPFTWWIQLSNLELLFSDRSLHFQKGSFDLDRHSTMRFVARANLLFSIDRIAPFHLSVLFRRLLLPRYP